MLRTQKQVKAILDMSQFIKTHYLDLFAPGFKIPLNKLGHQSRKVSISFADCHDYSHLFRLPLIILFTNFISVH